MFKWSSLFLFLLSTVGVLFHSDLIYTKHFRKGYFCYYTNLSNLLMVFYEGLLFLSFFVSGAFHECFTQSVYLIMTLCIWVTHIIYHFVLLPEAKRSGQSLTDIGFGSIGNIMAHYIVPLSVVLQWLVFAPKDALTYLDAVKWLTIPLAYFLYCMIRVSMGLTIGKQQKKYPYGFMDLDALGAKHFTINIFVVMLFFLMLGILLVFVSHILT